MKLYKEIGVTDYPSLKILNDTDSIPTGFEQLTSLSDWDKYGLQVTTVEVIRNEMFLLYTNPFNTYSVADGKILSKWFIAKKSDRDIYLSEEEQMQNSQFIESFVQKDKDTKNKEVISEQLTQQNTGSLLFKEAKAIPEGVITLKGNKTFFAPSYDGLLIQMEDSSTQTNVAGAYNGGGTGQKGFLSFVNYNNLLLSNLKILSFKAKNIIDNISPTLTGNIYWNILVNFNNSCFPTANNYANLVIDGLPQNLTKYYVLTKDHKDYTNTPYERCVKIVGGTGVINVTGTITANSNQVITISNIKSLTTGMFFKVTPVGNSIPDGTGIPDGTTILSIDEVNNSVTISNAATISGTFSLKQYGGISPIDRTGTCNNTTVINVSNTRDLQVNMLVTGTGIQSDSYITAISQDISITLCKTSTITGDTILSFKAIGKTGIPSNNENVGISLTKVIENNPNTILVNTTPTTTGGWASTDGGFPKNTLMGSINLCQGSSSNTFVCINSIKSITINNNIHLF